MRIRDKYSGKVTAISMGPPQAKEVLEWALTLGADEAILLCDRAFAAGDTLATAHVLAAGIQKVGPVDIIFCGNEAADGATQQVGPQIAELLEMPHVSNVIKFMVNADKTAAVTRIIEYGHLNIEVGLPVLISVSREINQPRTATAEGILSLGNKDFKTWTMDNIEVKVQDIGLEGSPTRVANVYEQKNERQREILKDGADEIVTIAVERLRQESLV